MSRPWSALGKRVAITGAGSGIGRALAQTLSRAGARSLLCLDNNIESCRKTVESLGSANAIAAQCDASNRTSLQAALRAADIDLFCANAGVATVGDCSAPEAAWDFTWRLNTMQTVYAAEVLVPSMIERGGGAFLVTASAAGLLTQLGSAPYAVTKAAAVGLSEWLAITHGDDGIRVCCVCPQGVRTPMIMGENEGDAATVAAAAGVDGLLEPEEVADEALRCLEEGIFLCMPGGDKGPERHVVRKAADRERWIGGMRRLQSKLKKAS